VHQLAAAHPALGYAIADGGTFGVAAAGPRCETCPQRGRTLSARSLRAAAPTAPRARRRAGSGKTGGPAVAQARSAAPHTGILARRLTHVGISPPVPLRPSRRPTTPGIFASQYTSTCGVRNSGEGSRVFNESSRTGSQYVYCSRSEKCDCRQRYGRLNHHQGLSPAREHRNIGRRKSGASVKGEKQVIDKPGSPLIFSHFLAKVRI
jgi:hypothetical protein